jgi:hypothetical protein
LKVAPPPEPVLLCKFLAFLLSSLGWNGGNVVPKCSEIRLNAVCPEKHLGHVIAGEGPPFVIYEE